VNYREPHTVLIVEDDQAFSYAASRCLESKGHNVITASGSVDALRILDIEPIDLVVIDVVLQPNEPHGISLARMIKFKSSATSVLFVTARNDLPEDQFPGEVLFKPVELDELARKVEELLTKQGPARRSRPT
jgi:DNA-binding response OmpR family regulator